MSVRDHATAHFAPVARHLARLGGRARIVVADAEGSELFTREADVPAPPASVIKLPLLMALYAEAAADRLSLDERLPTGAPVYGSGVLGHLRDVPDASLRDLATLAVIVSDNTATNRLIERLGFDPVNAYLDAWGCPTTRLRRAMYDQERKRAGLENVMTARETVRLLAMLVRGDLGSATGASGARERWASDAVLDVLHRNQDRSRLGRYLPRGARLANKSGWDEGLRGDAGVIRVERPILVAAFLSELRSEAAGDAALGVVGWCAYRAAGGEGEELPNAVEPVV